MDSDNRGLRHPLDRVIRPCGRYRRPLRLDLRQRGLPPLRDPPETNLGQWHPVYKRHYAKNLLLSRISQAFTPVYHPKQIQSNAETRI
jgi:hypothetical protein